MSIALKTSPALRACGACVCHKTHLRRCEHDLCVCHKTHLV